MCTSTENGETNMIKTIRAVYEKGVLRPLDELNLVENTEVVVSVESPSEKTLDSSERVDPLAGISFASGLGDLAKNFDDHRFGRK